VKCPKCGHLQNDGRTECVRCGLIFARYVKLHHGEIIDRAGTSGRESFLDRSLLHVKPHTSRLDVYARTAVSIALFVWSWWFILSPIESNYAGRSFMHLVNLPFHEAGHAVFRIFGSSLLTSLGGSLGQLIMPMICLIVLLRKTKDPFGASISLWWLGVSFLDLAPYINDARALRLQLLGGNTGASAPYGFHDWNFILSELRLLEHDVLIARLSSAAGAILMLLAFAWGSAVLYRQYRNLEPR
jgi:hypothetical protein